VTPLRRFPRRTFDERTLAGRTSTVAAVLVARDEEPTIAEALSRLAPLRERGLLDRLIVADGGSTDDTRRCAVAAGAEVVDVGGVLADQVGPLLGKGDSIWRTIVAVDADVLAFLDADLVGAYDEYVIGLLGPLLTDPTVRFVKGGFRRTRPNEAQPRHLDGGRVTEMVARPALNLLRPDLAEFYQPLGGQVAGHRRDLASMPIATGYAVEIQMLATVVARYGREGVVESDLGSVVNRERTVEALVPMAQEVLYGLLHELGGVGDFVPYVRPLAGGGTSPPAAHQVVIRPPAAEAAQGWSTAADSRRSDIGSS
jgi:glucosyl-3-phosphoglycerate synthase